MEFVQERLGLPSDRKIFTFQFFSDTKFYTLPDGYSDTIGLFYNTTNAGVAKDSNTPNREWNSHEDTEILVDTGSYDRDNRYAFTTMNGSNQLLLKGRNVCGPNVINPFNTTGQQTYSSSVTGYSVDSNIYVKNGASLLFTLTNAEGTSTISTAGQWDILNLLNSQGAYRVYVYFPTGAAAQISSVTLQALSSTGNYYTMSATTDYLGNAFNTNGWSLLSFNLDNSTTVGTPVALSITSLNLGFVHSGSFTGISNMRVNYLYQIQPDLLDFIYYSTYKGTDSTGTQNKILLDQPSDIASFGSFAPNLILPIALKGAQILLPQLRGDLNFTQLYATGFTETMLLYGKKYPRKRVTKASGTKFER